MEPSSQSENQLLTVDTVPMPARDASIAVLRDYAVMSAALVLHHWKRTAVSLWRMGDALAAIQDQITQSNQGKLRKDRTKFGDFLERFCDEVGISETQAYAAIKVARCFSTPDEVESFTITQAKRIAGALPAPKLTSESSKAITQLQAHDERPVPEAKEVAGDGGSVEATGTPTPEPATLRADWFERFSAELWEEMEALHQVVLAVQDWAVRQDHPLSAALLRVLIEAEMVGVEEDEGMEVVRVDDEDKVAALAAAEKALDPIFRRLGVTPDIAARHMLAMVQEGRGIVPDKQKPRRKTTRTT